MERIVVDRIDENSGIAILEINEQRIEVKLESLPSRAKEGDMLAFRMADNTQIKKRIQDLEKRIFK